ASSSPDVYAAAAIAITSVGSASAFVIPARHARVVALGAAGDGLGAADGAGGGERPGAGVIAGRSDGEERVRTVAPAAGLDDQMLTRVCEQLQLANAA